MAFWISSSEQIIRAEIDGPVTLDEPLMDAGADWAPGVTWVPELPQPTRTKTGLATATASHSRRRATDARLASPRRR